LLRCGICRALARKTQRKAFAVRFLFFAHGARQLLFFCSVPYQEAYCISQSSSAYQKLHIHVKRKTNSS
jgi:hypothetical protein